MQHDERTAVQQWLRNNCHGGYCSIKGLIQQWAATVGEIRNGYRFTIYDYKNDLDSRDILARLIENFPSLRKTVYPLLKPIDDDFLSITQFNTGFASRYPALGLPTLGRIPVNLIGELKTDLEGVGG